jgi:phenylalanyl-tRNA synthetase beta chain
MLFLKSWLEDYINLSEFKPSELAEIITRKSSEVEEVNEITERFEGKVLVGKIQSLRKHPEADKLNIFDVNLGEKGIVQIVSAATNARDGLMVPVALDGAKLAEITIQAKKLRGYESQGMCCGKSELLLETEYSSGLWELNGELGDDTFLGWSICEALPEYFPVEYVMDIKVLPDKIGVIGNHLGMALEIATVLERKDLLTNLTLGLTNQNMVFNSIQTISDKLQKQNQTNFPLVFKDETNYTNSLNIFQFKLEKPYRLDYNLQQRMNLIGKNLVGGLVDLSNYILFDVGQPNHFFSEAKLTGLLKDMPPVWNIQKLEMGQNFEGLGQLKSTNLPSNLVVLKQNNETLHIPGISGGESTKVEAYDTEFLVEIASFNPEEVGRNSFSLNYRSDGSKIWAGGVNPARILLSIIRLFSLLENSVTYSSLSLSWITKIGALNNINVLAEQIIDLENNSINLDLDYIIERMDGRDKNYWLPIVSQKLSVIGDYQNGALKLNIFYNRIRTQEDVLAEIVRLIEFENLQPHQLEFTTKSTPMSDFDKKQLWKKNIVNFGFYETITRPFLSENELLLSLTKSTNSDKSDQEKTEKPFQILNPYSSLQPFFRDSLLPSLLISTAKNIKRGEKEINLFEAGQVYTLKGKEKKESYEIWGISVSNDPVRITSLIQTLSQSLDLKLNYKTLNSQWNEIGSGVEYNLTSPASDNQNEDQKIVLLEINKKIKKQFTLPLSKTVWAFRISFTNGIPLLNQYPKYIEESEYPGITRSYSLAIPESLEWHEMVKIINNNLPESGRLQLLPVERLVDLDSNLVALNFQANLQSYEKTLDGQAVDEWEKNWQESLFSKYPESKLR